MRGTDSELGQVFEQIAAMAPDPSVLRARLAGRIRAHRQRRAILVGGAVLGAGAAIGVPMALAVNRPRSGLGGTEAPLLRVRRAPLGLRATWIPDGLVAYSREGIVGRLDGVQVWTTPSYHELYLRNDGSEASQPLFTLRVARMAPLSVWQSLDPSLSPSHYPLMAKPNTSVGGQPARIERVANGFVSLNWVVDSEVGASLSTILSPGSGEDQLYRLAESTVVDDDVACEVAASLGWVPVAVYQTTPERPKAKLHVYGSPENWLQTIVVDIPNTISGIVVDLFTTRSKPAEHPPGEPFDQVTLRERPGRVRYLQFGSGIEAHAETRVDLPDGRSLRVDCYVGADAAEMRANAIRITDELSIGPDPDLGWLGQSVPPR